MVCGFAQRNRDRRADRHLHCARAIEERAREDHYIDLDPQMQGEPYATPVIVGDDGVTRQKDIVHDIKQMPDDTAIVDVLYAGSKKGSKDDTKAEHMTMKKVDVRRLGLKPGTTVTLHVVDGAITLIER